MIPPPGNGEACAWHYSRKDRAPPEGIAEQGQRHYRIRRGFHGLKHLRALVSHGYAELCAGPGAEEVYAQHRHLRRVRYDSGNLLFSSRVSPKIRAVFFDELEAEALTRTSNISTFGWYGIISRKVDSKERLRLGFFSSDMPTRMFLEGKTQVLMNADTIVLGKHVGPVIRMSPTKSLEVVWLGSARADNAASPRYRGQVIIRYHLADAMNRLMRR